MLVMSASLLFSMNITPQKCDCIWRWGLDIGHECSVVYKKAVLIHYHYCSYSQRKTWTQRKYSRSSSLYRPREVVWGETNPFKKNLCLWKLSPWAENYLGGWYPNWASQTLFAGVWSWLLVLGCLYTLIRIESRSLTHQASFHDPNTDHRKCWGKRSLYLS